MQPRDVRGGGGPGAAGPGRDRDSTGATAAGRKLWLVGEIEYVQDTLETILFTVPPRLTT